ncbi:MAG: RDD family protein [Actinomycetota bacterium]
MHPVDQREADVVPGGLTLATIGRRAVGAIIDQFIVLLPVAIGAVAWGFRPGDIVTDSTLFVINISSAGVALVYETLLIGLFGRTIGKLVTGTRVVRRDDGGRVGWFAAAQRALVPVAAGAVPKAGIVLAAVVYGVAFLGPLRQGIHDRAAGTLVVRR